MQAEELADSDEDSGEQLGGPGATMDMSQGQEEMESPRMVSESLRITWMCGAVRNCCHIQGVTPRGLLGLGPNQSQGDRKGK